MKKCTLALFLGLQAFLAICKPAIAENKPVSGSDPQIEVQQKKQQTVQKDQAQKTSVSKTPVEKKPSNKDKFEPLLLEWLDLIPMDERNQFDAWGMPKIDPGIDHSGNPSWVQKVGKAVSYTHLTLPTIA